MGKDQDGQNNTDTTWKVINNDTGQSELLSLGRGGL